MTTGTIKVVNPNGFAFVTADGEDVFLHHTDCESQSHV